MSDRAFRIGIWVIAAVFFLASGVWLFSIGPLGHWRWHDLAELKVPATAPLTDYMSITGGAYVASAPFRLSGRPAQIVVRSLTLPSQERDPLHADVTWEVSRSTSPPPRGDTATPSSGGMVVLGRDGPGTSDPAHAVRVPVFGDRLPAGEYRLFAASTAQVTLSVRESRSELGVALLLVGGLVLSMASWSTLGYLETRRHSTAS